MQTTRRNGRFLWLVITATWATLATIGWLNPNVARLALQLAYGDAVQFGEISYTVVCILGISVAVFMLYGEGYIVYTNKTRQYAIWNLHQMLPLRLATSLTAGILLTYLALTVYTASSAVVIPLMN